MYFVTFLASTLAALVHTYPTGPPLSSCQSMTPGHGVSPQSSAPPYTITINTTSYSDNDIVEVNIQATSGTFRGVFVQARSRCGNMDIAVGTFSLEQGETYLQLLDCNGNAASAVAHSNRGETTNKTFYWTPPSQIQGNIYFRGTFVQDLRTFWVGVSSPELMDSTNSTCPETTTMPGTTTPLRNTTINMMTRSTPGNGSDTIKVFWLTSLLLLIML